jgi:hypothetical protein
MSIGKSQLSIICINIRLSFRTFPRQTLRPIHPVRSMYPISPRKVLITFEMGLTADIVTADLVKRDIVPPQEVIAQEIVGQPEITAIDHEVVNPIQISLDQPSFAGSISPIHNLRIQPRTLPNPGNNQNVPVTSRPNPDILVMIPVIIIGFFQSVYDWFDNFPEYPERPGRNGSNSRDRNGSNSRDRNGRNSRDRNGRGPRRLHARSWNTSHEMSTRAVFAI